MIDIELKPYIGIRFATTMFNEVMPPQISCFKHFEQRRYVGLINQCQCYWDLSVYLTGEIKEAKSNINLAPLHSFPSMEI